jgi:hypothetical protein
LFAAEAVGEPPQLCAAWFDQKEKGYQHQKAWPLSLSAWRCE